MSTITRGNFSPQLHFFCDTVIKLLYYLIIVVEITCQESPKWIVVSVTCVSSYFYISKVSYGSETTEFRQSIVDTDFRSLKYENRSGRQYDVTVTKVLMWYSIPKVFEAPNHTISFTTVYFVTAQRETKPLCETLGFAPLLIPWFTLFTLPSDNVVVCKQRRSIDRLSMIRNKIVLFMVAPFPTLIILNAINSIQPILRKETIRTPLLFCVFVWELWTPGNTTSRCTRPRNFKRGLSV